jgi:xylulokinase
VPPWAWDAQPGDVVVSLGTSGTAFAVSRVPAADASGLVAGFADATGHFLPLVCTLNAARVLTSAAALLGVDVESFAELALSAEPGAGGLVLLPYLDGERTPNLPDARGSLHGITRANLTPANIARASIEGMLGGLADAVDALVDVGVVPRRIILVGGAAANPAVSEVAATMFTVPVEVPPPGEYVADGAARQAAWALAGTAAAPQWAGCASRIDHSTRALPGSGHPRGLRPRSHRALRVVKRLQGVSARRPT